MKLNLPGTPKLTYCLNIHAGEAWAVQRAALENEVLRLKKRLGNPEPFGVGLRIGAEGVQDLQDPGRREEAVSCLRKNGLDPFTFNGFPYGVFHGSRVKETVYQPDWKMRERVEYSKALACLMAEFSGSGTGSISTVPGTFGRPGVKEAEAVSMAENLAEVAAFLHELAEKKGMAIVLGLEPEPACFIETTGEFLAFYHEQILGAGQQSLQKKYGWSKERSEEILRRHLGICLDTCHAAIQFERVEDSLERVRAAGIPVAKIQISNALEIRNSKKAREALRDFIEPVYLHQVRAEREKGVLASWTDLEEGLAGLEKSPQGISARIHFHVPLFWEGAGELGSTHSTLTPEFWRLCAAGASPHLEIETYTFAVLPGVAGKYDLVEMLEREYRWVLDVSEWATPRRHLSDGRVVGGRGPIGLFPESQDP